MLKGTLTAMITPMQADGTLDEEGLTQNINLQLQANVEGLVLLGTTGEAATLTPKEKERIVAIGAQEAKGKTTLIVGTSSNCTQTTIANTKRAQELGADAALIATPYYNKPTQEGIYRHFEAITKSCDLPILVYNIPGRTGANIEVSTLCRIAKLPHIIGVKEASGNLSQVMEILQEISPPFSVLSGDDATTLPLIALGAQGVVSVASNLLPQEMKSLVDASLQGNFAGAREIHRSLFSFFQHTFLETNPLPIKEMMSICGHPAGPCRLPLCEMREENREKIRELMLRMELMEGVYGR